MPHAGTHAALTYKPTDTSNGFEIGRADVVASCRTVRPSTLGDDMRATPAYNDHTDRPINDDCSGYVVERIRRYGGLNEYVLRRDGNALIYATAAEAKAAAEALNTVETRKTVLYMVSIHRGC